LFVFTVEVVLDERLLEAEIFSFIKPHQNGSVNARPSKQKLIQTHTKQKNNYPADYHTG